MQVPHFEGLTVERMLHHANKAPDIMKAFPVEEKEIEKFPRAYIANVMFTIIGDSFRQWVLRKCEERHAKIVSTQDMAINMDPEVYKAFMASKHISGKSIIIFS
jgi:hypothetical protein